MNRTFSSFFFASRLCLLLLTCVVYLPRSFGKNNAFLADQAPPLITYTVLNNTSSVSSAILNATITDETGVSAAAVHYKKNVAGTYSNASGTMVSGTNLNGTWSFNINLASLSPAVGDTIYYFVVAQDALSQLGSLPAGAAGSSPGNITTFPSAPNKFVIVSQISGNFLIGASQTAPNYTSITQALNDIAAKEVTGDVNLLLQSNYVSTSEAAFPVTFKPFISANPGFTVTLKPDAGVSAVISGSNSTAILKLANGAHHYVIDGSNNGTDSRNLFVMNTSSSTSSVVQFEGLASSQGVKNSVLKNTIIKGGAATSTIGVLIASSNISVFGAGKGHELLQVSNNMIYNCNTGIAASGTGNSDKIKKITIDRNIIGTDSASFYNRQYGIYLNYTDSMLVQNNKIYNYLSNVSVTKAAMHISSGVTNSMIRSNTITGIYSPGINGYGAYGINFESANNANDSLVNNSISDLVTSNSGSTSAAANAYGIRVAGSVANLKLYFNSVHLSGQITTGGSTSTSSALFLNSTNMAGLDIRNNIFSNTMTGVVSTSKHYAFRWAGPISGAVFNYNVFYAASTQGILMFNNGTDVNTIAALRTATSANANSQSIDPRFNHNTNLTPNIGSPVVGAGTAVAGLTTDITGAVRNTTPSIGAYENGADVTGPVITYTKLPNNTALTTLTTSSFASITDASAVNVTAGSKPRLYYRKYNDANVFGANNSSVSGWKWVESLSNASPFDFVIDYSLLNGGTVSLGDSIKYFVIAQDVLGYVGANPSAGLIATSVDAISSAPQNPNTYLVVGAPLAGNYTIGAALTNSYQTITSALNDLTNRGVSSSVVFELTDAFYSAGETFPLNVREIPGASAVHTVTIKPAAGVNSMISESNTQAIIKFTDRVQYFILDGSNNGSGSKNLVIRNTSPTASSVVFFEGLTPNAGVKNSVLKNTIIKGSIEQTIGVLLGGTGSLLNGSGRGHEQLLISNNTIYNCHTAIAVMGAGLTDKLKRITIEKNLIGTDTIAFQNAQYGIYLNYADSILADRNKIYNFKLDLELNKAGIQLNSNVTNSTIRSNTITGIYAPNTYGYGAYGINFESTGNANDSLVSNSITDLITINYSISSTNNAFGIRLNSSVPGLKIYFNTVHLSGQITIGSSASGSSALFIGLASNMAGLDIRNNIFSNIMTGSVSTSKHYAFRWGGAISGAVFDHNVFYAASSQGILMNNNGTDVNTIADLRTATAANANSKNVDPQFNSNTNLVLKTGSPLVGAGTAIAGVTTDITGAVRNSPPSIGAFENAADFSGPEITYTKLFNSNSFNNLTTSSFASITDFSGVDVNTGTKPRLYFKKSTDANTFGANNSSVSGWKWVESFSSASPFDFTIDYALLSSGIGLGDRIEYFVVAQDVLGNVSTNPSGGVAASVDVISSAPGPDSYLIVGSPLAGNYTIGAAVTNSYQTITAALNDVTNRGVSSAVLFELTDGSYAANETFPLTVGAINGASAINTVMLKPATGVFSTISGASGQAIVKFADGAQYFTLDGSNSGTNSKDLVLINNSTAGSVVWFEGLTANRGVRNSVLKNTIINGGNAVGTTIGVLIGGAAINVTSPGKGHDRLLVSNNTVYNGITGIAVSGASLTDKVKRVIIEKNVLGDVSASSGSQCGIYLNYADSMQIRGNKIHNFKSNVQVNKAGIQLNIGVTNSTISANTISGIYSPNTFGFGAYGINIESTGNANDSLINNNISDIMTGNFSITETTLNAFGIRVGSTVADLKIYFNTVHLTGQIIPGTSASSSAALLLTSTNMPGLDIRNNIFSNTMTGVHAASRHYALRLPGAISGAVFNYNVFYANSSQGVLMLNNNTDVNTIAGLRTATGANANSQAFDPQFNANNNLVPKIGSPLVGAGTAVTGVTTDITGAVRNSPPSIGAYEHAADLSGPVITYTKIPNSTLLTGLSTSSFAGITDTSGVDVNPGSKPRLYYRKHSDANVFGANNSSVSGWKWVESSNSASPFDFNIDYTLLNGGSVAFGDTIRYFVIAQDVNGYVSASPSQGLAATSVAAVTSAPQIPDYYILVGSPMTGTYTVGTSGTYATLTNAALDIALRGLQGNVTLEVLSSLNEPGPVAFSQWTETGAGNYRLTIAPSAANQAGDTIFATAASRGVIEFQGTDRVTIDGRINGAGNLLTVVNRATSTTQYGIRYISQGLNAGATDNLITNVNVRLNYQTGDQAQAIRLEGDNNHNFQVLNSNITRCGLGIFVNATTAGTGNHNGVILSENTIGGPAAADYVQVAGISAACAPGIQITRNHILNIAGSSYAGSYGIQLNQHTSKAVVARNKIHDITNSYYYYYSGGYATFEEAAQVAGIDINSSTQTDSILIANNVIYRLANASYSANQTTQNPFGISIEGGNGHQVLHNSVYMSGTNISAAIAGTLSAALMVNASSLNLKVVNNIFANGYRGKSGSKSYTVYAVAASSFAMIDYNNYDTTGAGTFARLGFKGSDALTMGAWKTLTAQDQSSVSVPSMFTSATNLQISSGSTPTPLESGAMVLANITTDHNNDPRPKTSPSTYGGNTLPDIGAYEFDGAPSDIITPLIAYTPLPKLRISTTGETLTATITDAGSGVNASAGTAPRVYFKKKNDANVIAGNTSAHNGWKYAEASNTTSPFSFSINYSIINGGSVSPRDTIYYFVAAQDLATSVNTGANPSAGFAAGSVGNITGLPTNPNFYIVTNPPLNGPYTVGAAPANSYQTITGALGDLALRGVSGPVVFQLTDAAYSSAETFPLTVHEIIGASAANTVTIKPAPGVSATITGSNTLALVKISDKVEYFTLDGSNNGSGSRDLWINNTSSSVSSVVWLEGLEAGVKNSTVKNTKIKGGSKTSTIGVLVGGSAVTTTSAGRGHASISLLGNNIYNCNAAIVSGGTASSKVNNLVVSGNLLGTDSTAFFNRQYGVYLQNNNRAVISRNQIINLKTSDGINNAAVHVLEGTANSTISSNTISGIHSTNASGYGAHGINIGSGTDVINDSIYNNMISDIITSNSSLTNTLANAFGIRLTGGSNLRIYHNTVNLYGQPATGTSPGSSAALVVLPGTYANVDIRNNIFTNSMTGAVSGSRHHAYWITMFGSLNAIFNYNNFYVSGPHGVLMNNTGSAINTLADLQTATRDNANSQNVSMDYLSPSDLHLGPLSNGNRTLAGTPITAVRFDIDNNTRSSSFPYMGAHEASTPLPVELISFKAVLQNEDVVLNWSTASEINNKGFAIERSEDNVSFREIGFVNGAGNSKSVRRYAHTDANAFANKTAGTLYYRLVQTDENGSKRPGAVESVTKQPVAGRLFGVYPNPFTTQVNVLGISGVNTIEVSDMQGRVVMTQAVQNDSTAQPVSVDLGNLDAGVYFLKLHGSENKVVKLVKTN